MGHAIVKLHNYYLEYSSVVDAPITAGMTLNEFKEYYKNEYGRAGLEYLNRVLPNLQKEESTSTWGSIEDCFSNNRAYYDNPNAKTDEDYYLTPDEIYKAFCLGEPVKDNWLPEESKEEGNNE